MGNERYYWGVPKNTELPIDGVKLLFSTWDYDKHSCYHLSGWNDPEDDAVMRTMYQTDDVYGPQAMPIEEFTKIWQAKEYDPPGAFCLELDQVEIIEEIVLGEKHKWK